MDKAELKRVLKSARDEPVNMAFALGSDGAAILVMDKRKPGRALEKQLKDEAPDSKNHRFGTASVDAQEPKLVRFMANKAAGSMARKLVVALKGTGYSQIELGAEDGGPPERASDESDNAASAAAAPSDATPPDAGSAANKDATPDRAPEQAPGVHAAPAAAALRQELTGLVTKLLKPGQQAAPDGSALDLAKQAQAALKSGDVQTVETKVAALRRLAAQTEDAPAAPAAQGDAQASTPPEATPAGDPASATAPHQPSPLLGRARTAWDATMKKVEGDVRKMHEAVHAAYKDHGVSADLGHVLEAKAAKVLASFDGRLSTQLGALVDNRDAASHAKLVADARQTIARLQQQIAADPVIGKIDKNPFVSVSVGSSLADALKVLAKAVN